MVKRFWRRGAGIKKRGLALLLLVVMGLGAAMAATVLVPQLSESGQKKKNGTVVDVSHADQGYIHVKHRASKKRLKLRIAHGDTTYTYDLNQDGAFEVFPLQLGSGTYKISVYEQVQGSRYSGVSNLSFSAQIVDENLPFLYPNQYVQFGPESEAVAMSDTLCAGLTSDREKMDAVEGYVSGKFMYDYLKAVTVQSNALYLPDVDEILAKKQGICFDFAALVCCMLRAQGVPTQLVIGYADSTYHAWNRVLVDGAWHLVDTTSQITKTTVRQYKPERAY